MTIATQKMHPAGRVMSRNWDRKTIAVNTDIDLCGALDITQMADVSVLCPTGVTSFALWASDEDGGTYNLVDDTEMTSLTAGKWEPTPSSIFAHGFVKFVPNANPASGVAKVVGKS